MKKLLIIHTTYNILGGEDVAVKNEIKVLKNEYIIETIFFHNNNFLSFSQIISYLTNNNKKSSLIVQEKIQEFKPDVIYIHNTWFKASLGIFKIIEGSKIPTYLKLHNFRYDCTRYLLSKNHLNGNKTCPKCGLQRKTFNFINKYYSNSYIKSLIVIRYGKKYFETIKNTNIRLLVLTQFHLDYLLSLGFSSKKISVLHNPINSSSNNQSTIKSDYFTYSGRISEEKGVEKLIKAFLKSNINKTKLKILGEGPLLIELKKKYEFNKNIEFLGLVSNNKSQQIISQSKAVITFTQLLEGQPMLLCEASSYGVPSVFPDQGGIHEFYPINCSLSFNHNYESKAFDVLNKLSDTKLLKKEGMRNKQFLEENFSDAQYLKKFKKIIFKNE
jgi:glycosyltransferase involved in cell wall biosynthesis